MPKAQGRSALGSGEGSGSDESDEIHVQQGSYSYTAPDGTVITVKYVTYFFIKAPFKKVCKLNNMLS